jgi:hypothetical protein
VKKQNKKVEKKINKKSLLKKFLNIPRSSPPIFYSKEMNFLNKLILRYSEDFINVLTFDKKFDSLAILLVGYYQSTLDLKFRNFKYEADSSRYKKIEIFNESFGEDFNKEKKPKTIRQFLNG